MKSNYETVINGRSTSFNLSAAAQIEGFSLGHETRWRYWAILPVNEILDFPDIDSPNFMIWRFTTLSDSDGELEVPVVNIEKVNNTFRISWLAIPNATNYKVYGASDPFGVYQLLNQTPTLEYIDAAPGTMEFFKVIAYTDPVAGKK